MRKIHVVSSIAFENGRISNFEELVTLTLTTLDRVIPHTVVHHSSAFIYMPNFIEIEGTFVDGRTYAFTQVHLRPALLGRYSVEVDLMNLRIFG